MLPLRQKFGPFDFGLPETTATLPLTKGHLRRRLNIKCCVHFQTLVPKPWQKKAKGITIYHKIGMNPVIINDTNDLDRYFILYITVHTYIHACMHALHCITLHCIALRYVTLRYVTLRYIHPSIHLSIHPSMHTFLVSARFPPSSTVDSEWCLPEPAIPRSSQVSPQLQRILGQPIFRHTHVSFLPLSDQNMINMIFQMFNGN